MDGVYRQSSLPWRGGRRSGCRFVVTCSVVSIWVIAWKFLLWKMWKAEITQSHFVSPHISFTASWPFSGPTISSGRSPCGWSPCFVCHISLRQCLYCHNNLHSSCLTFLIVLMRGAEKNNKAIKDISSCAFLAHWMHSFLFSNAFCIRNSVLLWSTKKKSIFSTCDVTISVPLPVQLTDFCPLSFCHFCNKRNSLFYQRKIFLGNHSVDLLKDSGCKCCM